MDTLGVVEALAVGAGLALVLVAAGDSVRTLVTTRRRRGRRWPTPVYYRWSWRAWRAVGQRAGPERREGFLGVHGPLSLLGLLVLWVVLLVAVYFPRSRPAARLWRPATRMLHNFRRLPAIGPRAASWPARPPTKPRSGASTSAWPSSG